MNRLAPLFFFLGAIAGYLSHDLAAALIKQQPWTFIPLVIVAAAWVSLLVLVWRDAGRAS